MASKVKVTVNGKDWTSKFNSKALLVLQAEKVQTDAWMGAVENFPAAFVTLVSKPELAGKVIEVKADATEYLQGKTYSWTLGTIAKYIDTALKIGEIVASMGEVAPAVKIDSEKLAKGDKTPRATKAGESLDSLMADFA
jgi:uncharacterized protein YbjT (DUF2867 family)